MSEPSTTLQIDVPAWVDRAKDDPVAYLQRQAAEITLNAIALTTPLNKQLVLKGGILMGLVYNSPRQTSDIDLTATFAAEPKVDKKIEEMLNAAFPRVAAKLGYADIVLKTHSVKKKPKASNFEDANFPALKMKIAYALRGSKQAATLQKGKPINTMFEVDISFNEPLQQTQILTLTGGGDILAYDLTDLIAAAGRTQQKSPPRCLRSEHSNQSRRHSGRGSDCHPD